MIDIDALEVLAKAATLGNWEARITDPSNDDHGEFWLVSKGDLNLVLGITIFESTDIDSRKNSEYIAAAQPSTVLALIAEVRALREDAGDWKRRWQDAVDHASAATIERNHWQANHDNQVSRARFLIERGDIPLERVRAYEEMAALQAFHAFFRDRCESLFGAFGMDAIDLYNAAAVAARKEEA
jgi:hypothetical protein